MKLGICTLMFIHTQPLGHSSPMWWHAAITYLSPTQLCTQRTVLNRRLHNSYISPKGVIYYQIIVIGFAQMVFLSEHLLSNKVLLAQYQSPDSSPQHQMKKLLTSHKSCLHLFASLMRGESRDEYEASVSLLRALCWGMLSPVDHPLCSNTHTALDICNYLALLLPITAE